MAMLDDIEIFVAVVSAGSFSAAARKLGVTPSAVSRRIAALEDELGASLLARTTRTLRPTRDGAAFHLRCARAIDELREARRDLASAGTRPSGVLRVDAPIALGRQLLARRMPAFLERYPELDVELTLRDQFVDPIAEGVDVLVRIAPLADSSLVVKQLSRSRIVVCGAPAYLARRGTPATPQQLAHHACIGFLRDGRPDPWRFTDGPNVYQVEIQGRLHTNDVDTMLAAAQAGSGLIAAFDFLVADALATGALVEVLADHPSITRPIHALYPNSRHLVPKVRVFLDFLAEEVFAAPRRTRRR
ncbi:MAG: LysR substrate-binding domain-containing protein [Kofleriaceae bacterium]